MGGLLNEIGPEYQGRLNILKLNVEWNPVSAARYQIRSVPTIIAFNKGKQVRRIAGLIPIDQLRQLFDRLAGQERILREKAV
jgi:thioredoxin 1